MHQHGVDLGAEGPRLGLVQLEHGNATDAGARGDCCCGLGGLNDNDSGTAIHFSDALLPPCQEFLVLEWREEGPRHVVDRDARSMKGGNVRDQLAVVFRGEEGYHCFGVRRRPEETGCWCC